MTDNVFAPPRANVEVRTGPPGLWELPAKRVRTLYHASSSIRALGVLYGLGVLSNFATAALFLAAPAEKVAESMTKGVLVTVLLALGFLALAACISSFTRPAWGRWVGVVIAIVALLGFPLGTLIGILALVYYAQAKPLFGPGRFTHKEVVEVFKQRKHEK